MVHRRDVLTAMGGTLAAWWWASPGSAAALSLGRSVQSELGERGRYVFRTLDPHQHRTVSEIAELILPETDTPGAKAARVDELIDLMLTEWMLDGERRAFLEGLARLDEASREAAGEVFLELERPRQVEILKAQEREAIAARPEMELAEGAAASTDSPAARHFFDVMKWLTLVGYYTSDVGLDEELHHEVFPGTYSGCAPFDRG